jgi:hypothetical protein
MKTKIKTILHQDFHGAGFLLFAVDMSQYGYVVVGPVEVECEVPDDFNPTAAKISTLEKKLDAMSDEYQRNCASIRGQISDLQCIEHSPAAA